MKRILKSTLTIFLLSVVLVACGKYEEGPGFSLKSKKSRLAGKWKIENVTYNGTDVTASYQSFLGTNAVMEYKKDGTYTFTGNFSDSGTWEFSGDVNLVTTSNASGSTASTSEILRLKNKELKIKDVASNNDITIATYVSAD